ncbi:MAG: hydroxyproline-2-epimerase [Flammeovirgaceae bacterium]|nr:hydroxyproline-2-epimerase [Flammeovirgaceae bacterium]
MRKTFFCIDAHTCGNPVRLVAGGGPVLQGVDMSEKRQHFLAEYDWIRKGLMFEPRGHDMMSGSILFPASDSQNDIGVLFIETSGCLPMCGHGTIGTVTIAIEEGLIIPKTAGQLRLETPAGLVKISYTSVENKVTGVKLTNVPAYLAAKDLEVDCPNLGRLKFDVAYGGNFYAIIDPQPHFSGIQNYTAGTLISLSQELRMRINLKYPNQFIHPENDTIRNVSHLLWTGEPLDSSSDGRNAVFYGDKAIDRSPCGTGTSARMAQRFARGLQNQESCYVHESYIGSKFTGHIESVTEVEGFQAVVTSIEGWAKIIAYNQIIIDEDDPYAHGFQVI